MFGDPMAKGKRRKKMARGLRRQDVPAEEKKAQFNHFRYDKRQEQIALLRALFKPRRLNCRCNLASLVVRWPDDFG